MSWDQSQTQVIPSLSTIISYLQRSKVPWCPTLVLLSQTCFLLLLSGSYGYDRSCWFQAKMIINIRNELPSSCLGSAPKWSLPMNDRMHEMAYTWQNQGPVSINSCQTIEYLLKECITEEVPCVSLLRTVIMSGGNSRELNLWCPTLVLLSQTCFLLLLSGSYGYDRSCWFQAKMIINIRNELPSSCLGSAPKWSLPMNDRMHEMAYTWQNQGPVSINSC